MENKTKIRLRFEWSAFFTQFIQSTENRIYYFKTEIAAKFFQKNIVVAGSN